MPEITEALVDEAIARYRVYRDRQLKRTRWAGDDALKPHWVARQRWLQEREVYLMRLRDKITVAVNFPKTSQRF